MSHKNEPMTDRVQKTLPGHTPAPWGACKSKHGDDCSCGLVWSIPSDTIIAEVDGVGLEDMQANADLIARSPLLQAFALACVERIEDYLDGDGECPACETCGTFCGHEECTTLHVKHPDDCFYVMACEALGKPIQEVCSR